MRKIFSGFMILILLLTTNFIPVSAKTKIKVAYPIQTGLTEISGDGDYSGYTYDYLKELERFTDLEFEFITLEGDENEQLMSAMEKVRNGELDLMGAMIYDESLTEMYDYTSTNYGMGNMAIYVRSDNEAINDTNFYSLKTLDVGVVSESKKENIKLREFGAMNGIEIKQYFYDTSTDMQKALDNDEIESIAFSEQAGVTGNYRIVATFSPRPFYFVTTKGNSTLIAEMNENMTKLNKEQPSFMSELHEKYFSLKNAQFTLTDKEKEFIEENPVINVALLGGNAPFQLIKNNDEISGITIEVLDYIGKLSGIKFNYHYTDSFDEYTALLKDESILIAAGISSSDVINDKFSLSRSYLDSQVQIITRTGVNTDDINGKKLALPKGIYDSNSKDGDIVYYDTALQRIKAVDNGEADYTYLASHTALFYNSVYEFDNISIIPREGSYKVKNCLAVRNSSSTSLLNILNKGIDNVTKNEIQSIVFRNGTYANENVSIADYIINNPLQSLSILMILGAVFMIFRFYTKKKNDEKIINEYNRFQMISDLSGDCFIEYNVDGDILTLSGGSAKLFSDEKIIKNYLSQKHYGVEAMKSIVDNQRTYDEETLVTFIDGTERWQRVFLQPLFNEHQRMTHIIGKITDIQVQKEEQLLWKELAGRDSLTKIYNSATCREMIEDFLKESHDSELAFIILDIDKFKYINDTYGHLYGDQVLQKLAYVVTNSMNSTDIIGRVGGDEFIIGLKYPKSLSYVEEYCRRLMKNIADTQTYDLTISMGIAFSRENQCYDDIYQMADNALYEVKKTGRNNYKIANDFKRTEFDN